VAKFDTEDLLSSILAIMTDNGALNAKIAAIEAEKAAKGASLDPVLASVASGSYHEQTWSNKILNSNPAIFYGIENVQASDGGGGAVAKTYTVFVEVVMTDNGQTNDVHKRIARYSRALEELFADAYAPAIGSHVKVDQVRPISFKLELDSDEEIKVGGVSLTITLV
jgi:hypothetical protein